MNRVGALLLTSPLVVLLALASWVALALTRGGFETDPVDQLVRDLPMLLVSAGFGACAVWVAARVLRVSSWWALLGTLPALLVVSAYFTGAW